MKEFLILLAWGFLYSAVSVSLVVYIAWKLNIIPHGKDSK